MANADISNVVGESRHLPECDWGSPLMKAYSDILFGTGFPCQMCRALRACEQRVRLEDDDYAYVAAQAEAEGRMRGWREALDAAREAVARQCGHTKSVSTNYECDHDRAIAAINDLQDALQDDLSRYE